MSTNATIETSSIPKSFTASVDRPFEPIGKRWANLDNNITNRGNERLNDEQIKEILDNPQITTSTRLQRLTDNANTERNKEMDEEKIYNMSVKDLAYRTSDTVHNILDDIVTYNSEDGMRGFVHIFTKSDRLIYVGIIVIIFTILLLLIKTTD